MAGRAEPHRAPLGKEELLSRDGQGGVDGVVIVPPSREADRNDVALMRRRAIRRLWIMGRPDLTPRARTSRPPAGRRGGTLGKRFTSHTDILRQPPLDGRFDWVWGDGEGGHSRHRPVPPRIHASRRQGYRTLPGAPAGARPSRLKSAKDVSEAANFATLDKVLALAKRPNVAAKVSAMPCYAADKTYPFRSVHPHIRRVFDAFGPKRTFWGTDWSRLPCTYRQGVTMFTEEMPWLKGEDLDWVMGRGVCDWIGWRM